MKKRRMIVLKYQNNKKDIFSGGDPEHDAEMGS